MFEASLFIIASIPCALLGGLAVFFGVSNHYRHLGYEPVVDEAKLQAELDAEFSPLNVDQAARLV